jgi:hypothetical protein
MRMRFGVPLVAGLLAIVATGGGYAIASGDSSGVLHACANRKSGVLRLARSCGRDERAITWNQVGPPGRRGAAGPVGPSDGYAAQTSQTGPPGGPIATALTLPPGDYSVTGQCQASIEEFGSSPQEFGMGQLELTIGPLAQAADPQDVLGQVEASVPDEGVSGESLGQPLQYGATPLTDTVLARLPNGGTIYDTCENAVGAPGGTGGSSVQDIEYSPPYVTAIRVGSVQSAVANAASH